MSLIMGKVCLALKGLLVPKVGGGESECSSKPAGYKKQRGDFSMGQMRERNTSGED